VNSLYDIAQVRGGADSLATHKNWDHAAYQIREGDNPELAKRWLEGLGAKYVLVHGDVSKEIYHDFKNIDKWENVGEVISINNGDYLINIDNSEKAWLADISILQDINNINGGDDINNLEIYNSAKTRNVNMINISEKEITVSIDGFKKNEVLIIAGSFDKKWTTNCCTIKKDVLGNMMITPKQEKISNIKILYK